MVEYIEGLLCFTLYLVCSGSNIYLNNYFKFISHMNFNDAAGVFIDSFPLKMKPRYLVH